MSEDLAPCPACGREVSAAATSCPGCGHPLRADVAEKSGRNARWLILAGVVIAAGTAAGIVLATGILAADKPTHHLSGRLELSLGAITDQIGTGNQFTFENGSVTIEAPDSPCLGASGYDDIREGTDVTVSDSAGKVVGNGSLGPGSIHDPTAKAPVCTFTFDVGKVLDSAFYKIEVAHRGQVTFTRQNVVDNDVTVTLGGS